ncbi:MAG: PAS domain-containing protein, partial [Gammaproteobacteria bacterium]|nr:PAS domain-containing protein [Gammaproteobacteria bacterium]
MILRSPVARISVGIAMLTLSLLLVADAMFGLSTEGIRPQLTARKHLAETLAVQYSELAGRRDFDAMRIAMDLMVRRNPEILSTAVRQADGMLVTEAGDHRLHWRGAPPVESSQTHARVPIFDGDTRWGTLEVRFTSIGQGSVSGLLDTPWFRMLLFVTLAGTLVYFLFMRRTLRHLDPSAVVPARVRSAFDVLAEGVVFLDEEARIVLSNSAFCALVGSSAKELMGVRLGKLGWSLSRRVDGAEECAPWDACLDGASSRTGMTMVRAGGNDGRREYIVNAAPVLDDRRRARGVIVTFDDVTELERKKNELESLVAELQKSRDEIQRQNEKLELMATRDGLTNCLNRRAFVEVLEREISRASRDSNPLSCIMLDLDHFKRIND